MLELTVNGSKERLPEGALDDAMRRFWDAKESGDTTANLQQADELAEALPEEEIVSPTPADSEDSPHAGPTVAEETIPPELSTPAGVVSPVAKARIEQDERILTASGFALPPPLFAPGTRVLAIGDENFRLERERVENLPEFHDAASALLLQVAAEKREDRVVMLKTLAMLPSGHLLLMDDEELPLETSAFRELCILGGFGAGARYLAEQCSADLRADNLNAQFMSRIAHRDVVLRTRGVRGKRTVFAVVSPSHAAADGAEALMRVAPALADARAEVVYDGTTTTATALWMPSRIADLAAGDVFKTGVRIVCDDTGGGRIRIAAVAFRNLCLNLIVIAEGEAEVASVVHRGDPEDIFAKLPVFVEEARTKVSSFLTAWGHARTLKLDIVATLTRWVEEKRVVVRGERKRENVVNALLTAWQKEPGDTLADAVNAVTRAAHETPRWGRAIREDLERQAGQLVYARR